MRDLQKSKAFYWEVLGLRTLSDLGIHAVLTGGLALQTEESWKGFVGWGGIIPKPKAQCWQTRPLLTFCFSHLTSPHFLVI